MAKLFKEDGTEVEAYTEEELKAKQEEAVEKFKKDNPGASAELDEAKKKIADLTKEIEEGGMSEGQKARLKKDKDEAEGALKKLTDEFTKKFSDLEGKLTGGAKKKFISAVAGKDAEALKKLESKVESLMKTGEYANDEEGIRRAVTDAATLIQGKAPAPGILDGVTGSGDRGTGSGSESGVESTGSKALAKEFGISEEDKKTHAPKPKA